MQNFEAHNFASRQSCFKCEHRRPVMRCHRRNPKVLPDGRHTREFQGRWTARAVRAWPEPIPCTRALAPRESTTATQVNGNNIVS